MTQALLKTVQCLSPAGLHRMAYKEWGDPRNPKVLVCVHGLARVSDDFDNLARALCDSYRVVCPDVVGRGRSSWLRDPQYYQVPQYVSDMVTLLARVLADSDVDQVDWFGTSMGGLIGIGLASLPDNPVRKLVLNDVGSILDPAGLARIGEYIGKDVRFPTFDEAAHYIRSISIPFGQHTDQEWRKFAADVLRQDHAGQWILHYDPKLAIPIKAASPDFVRFSAAMLERAYDAITCPTLLVRGAESDLLPRDAAQAMTQRGPKARLVEFAGVGHAPTFVHADQIDVVREFLLD